MSIVLWTRLEALEHRVAALEANQAAAKAAVLQKSEGVAPALARSNATRKAAGEQLRGEIQRVIAAHVGPKPLTAPEVLRALSTNGGIKPPALRTVQWHLRAIRNDDGVAPDTDISL